MTLMTKFNFSYRTPTNTCEPGHEKMCLMSCANNKGTDQPAHPRSLISAFVVRCLDSISLDSIAKMSRLQLVSVALQAGLYLAWLETLKTCFVMLKLMYGLAVKLCCCLFGVLILCCLYKQEYFYAIVLKVYDFMTQ